MGTKSNELVKPPAGVWLTVEDWLNETKPAKGSWVRHFQEDEPVLVRRPKGLEVPVHWRLRFPVRKPLPQRQAFVVSISGGRVAGETCGIITPDHKLLWEVSKERHKEPHLHSLLSKPQLPPLRKTKETVAVLYIKDSGVYYHWMTDVLPKLKLMAASGIKPDRYVINGQITAPFQYETLEHLGIPRNRIIESSDNLHLQASKLIVSGYTAGIRAKWTCQFLRKAFLSGELHKSKRERGKRLFISRRLASKRKLVNEEDVMRFLKPRGFTRVDLEKLPVTEQARLFHSAEAIVAPHGAGLTNLVFCRPGTKVVEMFSPNHVHPCYAIISSHMGLKHYYLIGTGKRPPEYVNPQMREDNITVDLKGLKQLLELANIR